MKKTESKTSETTKKPVVKGKPTTGKYGQLKGYGDETQSKNADWYAPCDKYLGLRVKISRSEFL